MTLLRFAPGGYRYISSLIQHSAGVAAEPGFELHRARLSRPVPLEQGFSLIENHLGSLRRPMAAVAMCELRSPRRMNEAEFAVFNKSYVERLQRWGLSNEGENPVARSNVCPEDAPVEAPSLWAFAYTVPGDGGGFAVAGTVEAPDGKGVYDPQQVVRSGETGPDAMREKARYVLRRVEERIHALGHTWEGTVNVYTVHDAAPVLEEMAGKTLLLHRCRPPVAGLELEMDVQAPARELVL